jgi:hypothetical protein
MSHRLRPARGQLSHRLRPSSSAPLPRLSERAAASALRHECLLPHCMNQTSDSEAQESEPQRRISQADRRDCEASEATESVEHCEATERGGHIRAVLLRPARHGCTGAMHQALHLATSVPECACTQALARMHCRANWRQPVRACKCM